ncbi:MAG: MurT ligase domain-containing protein [Thermaerobacter sp.]|nr:MurT ligase domain-containing protein [Thermaerobacter sp.]
MIRLWLAVWMSRLAGWASRLTGRGGSSLPGVVARRIDPRVLSRLTARLPQGAVLLTGTNGKTTTSALTAHLLRARGWRVIHNHAGANLILGLTAAMTQAARCRIYPRADVALLETDEATMSRASLETRPRAVLVTNFFRDQLDRYGELSTTVAFAARGIASLAEDGWLVLNADDPQVAQLGAGLRRVVYYGLAMPSPDGASDYQAVDAQFCPRCGQSLTYQRRFFAHLGWYECEPCGWRRPHPDLAVERWNRAAGEVEFDWRGHRLRLPWQLPGLYNLYNLAAAAAMALTMGMVPEQVEAALQNFRPAFGRMEPVRMDGATVWLALVKNPVGFNQVLQAVSEEPGFKVAVLLINDRYADGQDVSWLWDVDFEGWVGRTGIAAWWVGGIRARDMAVRLKYAGVAESAITIAEDPEKAFASARQAFPAATTYVLPTYTALLEIRRYLARRGHVRHFREG